ncbi:zinc-dependent metalloprotease [Bacteroidota bacterium]
MKRSLLSMTVLIFLFQFSIAQKESGSTTSSISDKTKGCTLYQGYFDFYWNPAEGQVYMELETQDEEFLMISYLSNGMGSNDVGLDRGKIGAQKVVAFHRSGNKVLLVEPNYNFRANSKDELERKAVEESFARSVIWGFKVIAEENGSVLIDVTDLLLSDQNHISTVMSYSGQGAYKVDASRSAINMNRTRNFPENTEFDATLTFSGQPQGRYVGQVVPTASHMTLGQHISFVNLPKLGEYQPRLFTPGSGFISLQYMDLAVPLGESLTKQNIYRHRLEKKNPSAEVSEAVEPIIYYLDPGTPEPMRSALLEGAAWWGEAFEAIGYKDAYQVKLLPEDADPLDIRYNVIQWVHRSTRGWSYGDYVTDPRTGEILKGHVSLGSQRVRQDYMIAEAILSPYGEENAVPSEMEEMALARLRQLSAHEVGHTLGFMHNYIASADGRSSVMDYPHPLITLKDGKIDLSDAYDVGIGEWDKVYVAYGYQDFPKETDEDQELKGILEKARKDGLRFLSDRDAIPKGSAHPANHLWDNGENASEELKRVIELRMQILKQFSEKSIRNGIPYSEIEDLLVPAFMFHRYQLEAAVKTIGGVEYNYALRGEDLQLESVSPEEQRACLETVLETLAPEFLAIPKQVLAKIPPKPLGYQRDRENFKSRTGLTFDPLSAAEASAELTLSLLLNAQRASRLVSNHAVNPRQPELQVLVDKLIFNTWQTVYDDPYLGEIQRVVDNLVLYHLMQLASDRSASTQARAIASVKIDELGRWITEQMEYTRDAQLEAHYSFALKQISYFNEHPDEFEHETPMEPPPGSPIGDCGLNY